VAYKYQEVWDTIKAELYAEVTVSEDYASTLIQGVKRTKCAENAHRSSVGLIPWSKLVIHKELLSTTRKLVKIRFELLYDTRI